jgi:hypothetical protein
MDKNEFRKKVKGLVVGIRFEKSFRVGDILGKIADDILYNKNSPFGAEYFPNIQSSDLERFIFNDKTKDYIRINPENIILYKSVDEDFDKQFTWTKDVVLPFFEDLFADNNIKNIVRIGFVIEFLLEKNEKILELPNSLGDKFAGINGIRVSFSKKYPTDFGLTKEKKNDYKNVIYSFDSKEDKLAATIDYQYFYSPSMDKLTDCNIKQIADSFKKFFDEEYSITLISLYGQKE